MIQGLKTENDYYADGSMWCEGTYEYCTCHIDSYNCLHCEASIKKQEETEAEIKKVELKKKT